MGAMVRMSEIGLGMGMGRMIKGIRELGSVLRIYGMSVDAGRA